MISYVVETLFILQQNTKLYVSKHQSKNSSSRFRLEYLLYQNNNQLNLLNSFGNLVDSSEYLVGEKNRLIEEKQSRRLSIGNYVKSSSYEECEENNEFFISATSLNLEHILKYMIRAWILHIKSSDYQAKEFYQSELVKLRNNLIQKSIEFIDTIIFTVEMSASDEFEIYQKHTKINPEVLQKELEKKLRQEEDLILEKPLQKRNEFIVKLRSKKKNIFRKLFEKIKFEIIPFDIFPKGSIEISTFLTMLRAGGMCISYADERRLYKIAEKFPDYQSICRGRNDFDGFVVFRFEDTDAVIVEKPSYGNATYLIKGDWEKDVIKILQLSRGEARTRYPKQVKRVIHTSERQWLSELEVKFKYWF